MGTMITTQHDQPFWVVLDGLDDDLRNRFCRGHADETTAKADAADRTALAKEWGISTTYSAVPKP